MKTNNKNAQFRRIAQKVQTDRTVSRAQVTPVRASLDTSAQVTPIRESLSDQDTVEIKIRESLSDQDTVEIKIREALSEQALSAQVIILKDALAQATKKAQ